MQRDRLDTRLTTVRHQRGATYPVLIVAGSAVNDRTLDGPRVILLSDSLALGRGDSESGGWVLSDPEVSRRHAQITQSDDGYRIADLESTNGTYVDGIRIRSAARLRDGATIGVGPYVFVYRNMSKAGLDAVTEDLAVPFGPVSTTSGETATILHRIRLLARTQLDLLLTGETGVGKEIYARAIHRESGRKGDLIAINCAALPETLVESELFGYAKGAHSTASDSKTGLLEAAHGGTLFLDEIGDMPLSTQTKLLRFLQDRRFIPLGCTRTRQVDVRIIAATRRGISADDGRQGLRLDLAARLGPEALRIPSLRNRIEDVGNLVWYFMRSAAKSFSSEAFAALFLHDWPGNIRELEKAISMAVALSEESDRIGLEHLPNCVVDRVLRAGAVAASVSDPEPMSLSGSPSREVLEKLLRENGGDVARVARQLGRQRTLVWRWLRKYGCEPALYRG
ncbi:MAG TPA: sigma 54-interacting transcriptional regulator [Polyangia bacterium]|nr:sigma 54-interacting transcriptional regulator [Polyangia bacterium]